jgi:hypothetical protein
VLLKGPLILMFVGILFSGGDNSGIVFTMMVGFSIIVYLFIKNEEWLTGGSYGFIGIPRAELLPPKEYMRISWLPTVSVCAALDTQIRKVNSTVHVCGHTHTTFDRVIDNVRYIQNAVRYPKERRAESFPIKLIL